MKKPHIPAALPPIDQFHLPRYQELTDVGLYLEQTVRLLNSFLAPLGEGELTASMVSNYVKQKLLPRPEKKLYYASHLARLAFIDVAKTVAALDDIRLLLLQGEKYELATAYDYFCESFEDALFATFGFKAAAPEQAAAADQTLLRQLIRAAVDKIYLDHCLRSFREQAGPENRQT